MGLGGGIHIKDSKTRAHLNVVNGVVGDLQGGETAVPRIQRAQKPTAVLGKGTNNRLRVGKAIRCHTKPPLRAAKFGRHGVQRFGTAVAPTVQIPPIAAVGHKIKRAIWSPFRLKNGLVCSANNAPRIRQTIGGQVRQPEFRAIPGHIGMVPCQPDQLRTVRAEARRAVESIARRQHCATVRPV